MKTFTLIIRGMVKSTGEWVHIGQTRLTRDFLDLDETDDLATAAERTKVEVVELIQAAVQDKSAGIQLTLDDVVFDPRDFLATETRLDVTSRVEA